MPSQVSLRRQYIFITALMNHVALKTLKVFFVFIKSQSDEILSANYFFNLNNELIPLILIIFFSMHQI